MFDLTCSIFLLSLLTKATSTSKRARGEGVCDVHTVELKSEINYSVLNFFGEKVGSVMYTHEACII